jgi:hypothetical protein
MEERINKPRVFLSHSKKNVDFIEKLATDLRKCQIEPWLDTDQIRHGKSWQNSIFEDGIPTCDAIIVYFTEISIQSTIVKKEMDAGLLQNIKDNNVAFLPYVNDEKIREELRADIQALQVPVWNDKNYAALLPIVVSEIWRSYLERTTSSAIKNERLKRVEAELELTKYKNQPESVFSVSENKEFEFIWNSFDKKYIFSLKEYVSIERENSVMKKLRNKLELQLSTIFFLLNELFTVDYVESQLRKEINELACKVAKVDMNSGRFIFDHSESQNITDDLLTHGLVEAISYTISSEGSEYLETAFQFTKKYFRFRFWLAYNKKLPERTIIEIEK